MKKAVVKGSATDALSACKSLDFYVVLCGLALCRAWIVLCLSAPFVAFQIAASDWLFLIPGGVSTLVVAFLAYRTTQRVRFDKRFKVVTGALVGLCVVAAPFVMHVSSTATTVAFTMVGGAASCCLQVLWGVDFARKRPSFSLYCYPASAIVTALLVVVALADGSLVAFCLYPAASFLLLLVAARNGSEAEKNQSEQSALQDGEDQTVQLPFPVVGRLLASIVIFSVLCRLFDALPAGGSSDPLVLFGGSSLFALVATGVLFLVFALLFGKSFSPLVAYRLSLPLMAFGMTIIALFFFDHWYVSILLIGMGYELFDTLTWVLLVALAQNQEQRVPHLVVFGLGTAATMLGMGMGYFAGGLMSEAIARGDFQIPSVGIVCVMALFITAFLVLPEGTFGQLTVKRTTGKRSKEGKPDVPVATVNPLEAACHEVASQFHLTPRESEVLLLLARGRTLAIVMRDLHIAKGTAQTHIENVYAKLGVHKQQELIDLVEGSEVPGAASET